MVRLCFFLLTFIFLVYEQRGLYAKELPKVSHWTYLTFEKTKHFQDFMTNPANYNEYDFESATGCLESARDKLLTIFRDKGQLSMASDYDLFAVIHGMNTGHHIGTRAAMKSPLRPYIWSGNQNALNYHFNFWGVAKFPGEKKNAWAMKYYKNKRKHFFTDSGKSYPIGEISFADTYFIAFDLFNKVSGKYFKTIYSYFRLAHQSPSLEANGCSLYVPYGRKSVNFLVQSTAVETSQSYYEKYFDKVEKKLTISELVASKQLKKGGILSDKTACLASIKQKAEAILRFGGTKTCGRWGPPPSTLAHSTDKRFLSSFGKYNYEDSTYLGHLTQRPVVGVNYRFHSLANTSDCSTEVHIALEDEAKCKFHHLRNIVKKKGI